MHDPRDHEGTLSLMDSARMALEAPAPYGFDEKQWDTLLDAVGSLVLLVGDEAIDDDSGDRPGHHRPHDPPTVGLTRPT